MHRKIPPTAILVYAFSAALVLSGCQSLARKFIRKPKKENIPRVEMVLEPEEYKGTGMTTQERYRQCFLFWQSWQDELIESLSMSHFNHKKQISCVQESIKNLVAMQQLLQGEPNIKLDAYIAQLNELKDDITRDVYGRNVVRYRNTAERIKRAVMRYFSFNKITGELVS